MRTTWLAVVLLAAGCSFDTGGLPADDPGDTSADPDNGTATPLPPTSPPPPIDADLPPVDPVADAAPTLGDPGDPCQDDRDCALGVCRDIEQGPGGRVCLQTCGFGQPPCPPGSFCVADGVCTL